MNEKQHQIEAIQFVKYVTTETQVHKHNYKECEEKSEGSLTRQTSAGTLSSLLASVAVMLFQTDEAYSNSGLTKVKYNNNKLSIVCLFYLARPPPVGQGLLIHEVSRSHTTTHHRRQDSSGRVISLSQRLLPDNTKHSQQTDIHAPVGIRNHSLSRRAAADLCLRPSGHWYRANYQQYKRNKSTYAQIPGAENICDQHVGEKKEFRNYKNSQDFDGVGTNYAFMTQYVNIIN